MSDTLIFDTNTLTVREKEDKPDTIQDIMSGFYDLAISHAIEVVRQHYVSGRENSLVNTQIDSIVIKLKSLKK